MKLRVLCFFMSYNYFRVCASQKFPLNPKGLLIHEKIFYTIFLLNFMISRKVEKPVGWIDEELLRNRAEEKDYTTNRK